MHNGVYGDAQEYGRQYAYEPSAQAHNESFGIEHTGDILFRSADGAQNADLLGALEHAYIGDDSDHDAGNY